MATECGPLLDLYLGYKDSHHQIKNYKYKLKQRDSNTNESEIMIVGDVENDLGDITKILKNKSLHELGVLSQEYVNSLNLTERQREIALLRQKYNNAEVAKILGLSPSTVVLTYDNIVKKAIKAKTLSTNNIPVGLSSQQSKIYLLALRKMGRTEIAKELSISPGVVKTQLKRIRAKTEGGTNK